MTRNVNIFLTNWHATGNSVPVDQYEVDITIQWIDDVGDQREHSETVHFPNVLAQVPLAWLREELEDLVLRAVRKKLEID